MISAITGIDHVLIGVRDLEAARQTYGRLGFTLTPRGSHIGWGTANYCIMFADDYVELIGIADASKFTNDLDAFLERRQGLMAVALASDDADAAYEELEAAGANPQPVKDLARNLELPEGTVQPRFKILHFDAAAAPALSAFVCQHLSPEMVRRPEWLEHANGAQSIRFMSVVVDDPMAMVAPYQRLFGADAVHRQHGLVSLDIGRTEIVFGGAQSAPNASPTDLPAFEIMSVTVDNLDRAEAALVAGDVQFQRRADGVIAVPPTEACGVTIEFCVAD